MPCRLSPLPARLLDLALDGPRVKPQYLVGPEDRSLAGEVLDVLQAHRGQSRGEVEERLVRRARECTGRRQAWLGLAHLVQRMCGYRSIRSHAQPALIRQEVFQKAALGGDVAQVIAEVASRLTIPADELVECLYADIPSERLLGPVPADLGVDGLVAHYNLALAQGLLMRSEGVRVQVRTNWATVLRHARSQKLLCLVERERGAKESPEMSMALRLSGPLSLFRHTTRYGRSMASWLPVLVRTPGWRLEASCRIRDWGRRCFTACHEDPISAVHLRPLREFDSDLERAFARDMARIAGERYRILREADPVQLDDGRVACPDFTLEDRERGRRVGVEIVGFWTPQYLQQKLALLEQLPEPWVVCIDERLASGNEARLPEGPLFRYRRRIVVKRFLEFLDEMLASDR